MVSEVVLLCNVDSGSCSSFFTNLHLPVLNKALLWSHNLGEHAEHEKERLGQLFEGKGRKCDRPLQAVRHENVGGDAQMSVPATLLKFCSTGKALK